MRHDAALASHPSSQDLVAQVAGSSVWSLLGQIVQLVLGLIGFALLARWLSPGDYGLVGMAATLTSVLGVVSDSGVNAALVRLTVIDEATETAAFWVSLFGALMLSLACAGAAPALVWIYGDPRVGPLALALSAGFLIAAPARVSMAKLQKALRFRAVTLISTLAGVGALGIACAIARAGGGSWSLVAQTLSTFVIQGAMLVITAPPRLRRHAFSVPVAKGVAAFGSRMSGFAMAQTVARVGDALLVGKFLGPSAVGMIAMGVRLMVTPIMRICATLGAIFLPTMGHLEAPYQRGKAFSSAVRLTAVVTSPLSFGVFALAPEIVVLLPPRWAGLAPVLRILSMGTLVDAFAWYCLSVLTAQGRAAALLVLAVALIPLGWGGSALGVLLGTVEWVMAGWAVWYVVNASAMLAMVWRTLGLTRGFWRNLTLPFGSALFMAIVVRAAVLVVGGERTPRGCLVGVLAGIIAYGLALGTLMRTDTRTLVELLRQGLRRSFAAS